MRPQSGDEDGVDRHIRVGAVTKIKFLCETANWNGRKEKTKAQSGPVDLQAAPKLLNSSGDDKMAI
jgi:hypothetical protein